MQAGCARSRRRAQPRVRSSIRTLRGRTSAPAAERIGRRPPPTLAAAARSRLAKYRAAPPRPKPFPANPIGARFSYASLADAWPRLEGVSRQGVLKAQARHQGDRVSLCGRLLSPTWRLLSGSMSDHEDQMNAASQPTTVQPPKMFNAAMAPDLGCLRTSATMDGRQYNPAAVPRISRTGSHCRLSRLARSDNSPPLDERDQQL